MKINVFLSIPQTARKIRTSPIFSELEARGAVFGEKMGWERPLYFKPYHDREDPPAQLPKGTFGKPEFFDVVDVRRFFTFIDRIQNCKIKICYLMQLFLRQKKFFIFNLEIT